MAEVMVMIAEPSYRRRGYAREAVLALMAYAARLPLSYSSMGTDRRPVDTFVAKISSSNVASQTLFTQRLGYHVYKHVPAFDEVHMRRTVRAQMSEEEGESSAGQAQAMAQVGAMELKALHTEETAFTQAVHTIGLRMAPFSNPEIQYEPVNGYM